MIIRSRKLAQYVPDDIREIASTLADHDHQCFVVGGAIRDLLRGESVGEFDLATDALPEKIEELFPETIPTGRKYGTITIKLNEAQYEITTFRAEADYQDNRHPEQVQYKKDIEEDLKRRDLTINAVAYNPITNELIDIFNGLEDIKNRLIKTVGVPAERFQEDGLRVIRVLRFLAKTGFALDVETGRSMLDFLPKWQTLAAKERIFEELDKTIKSENPDYALSFLGFPKLNELDKCIRWAAVIKEKREVYEFVQEKQLQRWIDKLLKYDLDLEKASLEITDLKVDGIDIMELGARGEEVGKILEGLLQLVVEAKKYNQRKILLEFAKDLYAGMTADEIIEREARKKQLKKQSSI